ncbi:class I SAM-dependent methyltransferase [Candidatus Absconditicoccus praedator]|uniref:class I SAM-dependent methyltransferase n=1 Tax=Candidatus Absconditicoccus praedator TaxID=2735562 RepID=UPI001E340947|nr:class I SAM-dependent methyltransferase [Candidatus Absconditicoccus praedator]UFX83124.1 class I SAM-dependent methyltransferase [Candidatus Absconditicoccus praedator]
MSYYNDVTSYFSKKASEYDLVDEQLYWVLSDELAKKFLIDILKENQKNELKLLDAGAGTGRWALNFYEILKNKVELKADLIDITKEMLDEADNKIKKLRIQNNFKSSVGNIENLDDYINNYYDFAISFYNVLSFVNDYNTAIGEVYKKLNDGGKYIGIVGNKHHSYYFSLLTNRINELDSINNNKIRFNDLMPYMHCFTPDELRNLFKNNGFKEVKVYGLLNYIYPGMEETFLKGQNEQKYNILKDKNTFNKILDLEYSNLYDENLASRGNTLLFIATK